MTCVFLKIMLLNKTSATALITVFTQETPPLNISSNVILNLLKRFKEILIFFLIHIFICNTWRLLQVIRQFVETSFKIYVLFNINEFFFYPYEPYHIIHISITLEVVTHLPQKICTIATTTIYYFWYLPFHHK